MVTLATVKKFVESQPCLNCGNENTMELKFYPHSGGQDVDDIPDKVWLYGDCRRCQYQSSIVKLIRVAKRRKNL
jgi:hypothetical protein